MNRIPVLVTILICLGVLLIPMLQPAGAQNADRRETVVFKGIDAIGTRPKVEIVREPVPVLQLVTELVEILPGETRRLTSDGGHTNDPSTYSELSGLRSGSTATVMLGAKVGVPVSYRFKIAQLSRDGLVVDVTIADESEKVLAERTLSLRNYQEGLVEFASTRTGQERLAVRFLPIIKAIPPVQEFPALVPLTFSGLLIRNGDELVSRGFAFSYTPDRVSGTELPFFIFNGQRTGLLIMSFRPFPGAALAGYFENKRLIFEWNGDTYEYLSLDKPFLPEGKWAAYFMQADSLIPPPSKGISIGALTADPGELTAKLGQMAEGFKGARIFRVTPNGAVPENK